MTHQSHFLGALTTVRSGSRHPSGSLSHNTPHDMIRSKTWGKVLTLTWLILKFSALLNCAEPLSNIRKGGWFKLQSPSETSLLEDLVVKSRTVGFCLSLWTKMLLIQPSKWPPPRRRDFWRFEEISSLSLFFRGWSSMRTRNLKEEESKTRVRRTGKKRLSLRGQLTVFNSDSMSFM